MRISDWSSDVCSSDLPRPPEIAAWDSLPAEKKRLYARMMEAYAAAIAYADDQIGRVLDEIERAGELDNTLVLFVEGDNGSSAEGGANGLFNETAGLNEAGEADYPVALANRSEEHTSELQSLMRISYAVFCLKKKHNRTKLQTHTHTSKH